MQASGKEFFGPKVLELCKAADVVFLGLHGKNGEDGKVQAAFDLLGIIYTGSGYLGSAIAMDKSLSKKLFLESGVPTPAGAILKKGEPTKELWEYGLSLPCVVKASCGGSSVGVYIVNTQEEYETALAEAFTYDDVVVLEQYIKGREFSVGVVDGVAYPIIEIAPIHGFYDYKQISGRKHHRNLPGRAFRDRHRQNAGICRESFPCPSVGELRPHGLHDE